MTDNRKVSCATETNKRLRAIVYPICCFSLSCRTQRRRALRGSRRRCTPDCPEDRLLSRLRAAFLRDTAKPGDGNAIDLWSQRTRFRDRKRQSRHRVPLRGVLCEYGSQLDLLELPTSNVRYRSAKIRACWLRCSSAEEPWRGLRCRPRRCGNFLPPSVSFPGDRESDPSQRGRWFRRGGPAITLH